MSTPSNKVLLIDGDPLHAKALEEALLATRNSSSNLEWVETLSGGLATLAHKELWAIFLNLSLPDSNGLETLYRVLSVTFVPVIVIGGTDDEEVCKTAMLHGARDYLLEG